MLVLLFAGAAVALFATAVITTIRLRPGPCYYCREPQPPHRLHKIKLSGVGRVDVCRDATACRLRHQRALAR